ncbi:sensor domain-containing diguanylate cyclase [Bacillus sp. FJAT-45350]|uniref:sensor domain-containing diguanylate cyclase n=1 Tax=Bacillus sp. FJAT-45350 TaxID=2011014 RepID=UPI00115513DC|nr:diguanylate cyclase [Bacillus sp. FJAT-45350]
MDDKKGKTKRNKIRVILRKWVLIYTFIIASLILLPTFLIEFQQSNQQTQKEIENIVQAQSFSFENWLNDRSRDINIISKLDKVRDHDFERTKEYFHNFIEEKEEFSDLVFVNENGLVQFDTVSASLDRASDGDIIDVRGREYFKIAKNEMQEHITDVLISKVTNRPIVVLASPVLDNEGNFNGVVFGAIDLSTIDELMKGSQIGSTGHSYIVNNDGVLLTESWLEEQRSVASHLNYKIDEHIFQLAKKNVNQSPIIYRDPHGKQVFSSSTWINQDNWLLITEVSAFDSYINFIKKTSLVGLSILVAIIIANRLLFYFSRNSIEYPIEQLLQGVKNLEDGNYSYKIKELDKRTTANEFSQLYDAFNRMSEKVRGQFDSLEEISATCQLTNLYNRHYLMDRGEEILNSCYQAGISCSCITIDVDYFKKVNDTFGHLVGDEVLTHVANVISTSVRNLDIVARYGGEEFVVVLPNSNEVSSMQVAARIREEVEANPLSINDKSINCTVSLGVAEAKPTDGAITLLELIGNSDKSLYHAKASGRNQIQQFSNLKETTEENDTNI